ncbi:hypothetical protein HO173_008893 [Letharia columbiana]|uniref:F-box domain-containing protein n=1 Tax=Letharia columbiana TaxID=112416 RepID=A0A8H6L2B8_9LECA|nr:uncharacterized protein HO173_008893 [Letharia columbiana]KAF6232930.1 hypothetical protein HO173_008893 [Letharia columbiana]
MATILGLPNELLSQVVDLTDPDDLESLSACCKRIHGSAEKRIKQHRNFKDKYTTITFDDAAPEDQTVIHPFVLLQDVLLEPRIAHYPGVINLRSWSIKPMQSPYYLDPDTVSLQVAQRCTQRIHDVITQCPYLRRERPADPEEPADPESEIQRGNPDAAIALLLTLFPNLQTLNVTQRLFLYSNVRKMIYKIQQVQSKVPSDAKSSQAFSKLARVDVSPTGDTLDSARIRDLVLLSALPSIETIRVSNMFYPDYVGIWPPTPKFIDVAATEIIIVGSVFASRILAGFLSNARSLRRFTYQHLRYRGHYAEWKPLLLVNILQEYTSNTLRHLDLTFTGQAEFPSLETLSHVCNFRGFPVLKKLRVDYALIASDKHNDLSGTQTLADLLPASLEELVIVADADEEKAAAVFEALPEMEKRLLPKLTGVALA